MNAAGGRQTLKFPRGALTLHISVSLHYVTVHLSNLRRDGCPMLAYASVAHDRARVADAADNQPPCIWLDSAAFDLRAGEVAAVKRLLKPDTLRADIAAAIDIAHPAAPPDVRSDLIESETARLAGGAA